MARLHSMSIGFPMLLLWFALVLSSLKANIVDKLLTISARSSSGVVPFVSGNTSTTKTIVNNNTMQNGTNE
jgi:hypothetical protein